MSERAEIKQVSTIGAQGTQVGIQNIHVGLSAQEASQIAIKLFMDNFPKLQEEARKVAEERADALCKNIIDSLEKQRVRDFSPFGDPDVQYIVLDAQKRYARFGTSEMLETLSNLVCKRIQNNNDLILKVTIDKAIEIAPMLTSEQFDLLSLLFFSKIAIDNSLQSLEQIEAYYKQIADQYSNTSMNSFPYLIMHGCLQIGLGSVAESYSQKLCLSKEEILNVCPRIIWDLSICDYQPSYVGTMLAIMNIEIKTGVKLNPRLWIN